MLHVSEIVILSGVTPTEDNTDSLRSTLKSRKVKFKEVHGFYKGDNELSFLCVLENNLNDFVLLGEEYKQECILYSSAMRETSLVYRDGKQEYIGQLVPVNEVEAKRKDSYTYCPKLNRYFITKKL